MDPKFDTTCNVRSDLSQVISCTSDKLTISKCSPKQISTNSYLVCNTPNDKTKTFDLVKCTKHFDTQNNLKSNFFCESLNLDNLTVLSPKAYQPTRFTNVQELGAGSFGTVNKMIDTNGRKTVAVKQISDRFDKQLIQKELDILYYLKSYCDLYFICLFDYLVKSPHHYIIMEFPDQFLDIQKFLEQDINFTRINLKTTMLNLSLAVEKLHHLFVVHNDLKPANILINPNTYQIKLIDFGLAQYGLDTKIINNVGGTRDYLPPEAFPSINGSRTIKLLKAGDVWALGLILYNLILGKNFYQIKIDLLTNKYQIKKELQTKESVDDLVGWFSRDPREKQFATDGLREIATKKYPDYNPGQVNNQVDIWLINGYQFEFMFKDQLIQEFGPEIINFIKQQENFYYLNSRFVSHFLLTKYPMRFFEQEISNMLTHNVGLEFSTFLSTKVLDYNHKTRVTASQLVQKLKNL